MAVDRVVLINALKRIHLFRGIDPSKLESLASALVPHEYKAGDAVFYQGDDSEAFYILIEGRLKVSEYTAHTHVTNQIGYLEENDYFGHEVLADSWPRQVTVEAVMDSVVMHLSVPDFKAILDIMPEVAPRLALILDSYRKMLKRFEWLDEEEYVYYITRRHPLVLILRLLPVLVLIIAVIPALLLLSIGSPLATTFLILTAVAAFITIVWGAWVWVDWSNDYYLITNRRVVYQEKIVLLYDSRQESPLSAMQSSSISTTFLGRILGYGNVAIRTYTGTIYFGDVAMPDQVLAMLQEQQLRAQTGQRNAEQKHIEGMIERSIGIAPPPPSATAQPPPPKQSDLQQFLSLMFNLRYEMGGAIVYRTHWFILLTKTFVPAVLLFGLVLWMVTRLFNFFPLMSIPATLALFILLGTITGGWLWYQYMDWHNDRYIISSEQVIDVNKKPLGHEHRDAAPIKNILSIEYKRQGIIGLILNFGTIYIRVGDKQLTFDNVFNPSAVQRELFDKLTEKTYAEKQAAIESERQRMVEWLGAYHRVAQRNQPPPPNTPTRGGF